MRTMRSTRTIPVPPSIAWEVATDAAFYGKVAPSLAGVEIARGHGSTAVRRCWDDAGHQWEETCPVYEEGRRVTFQVNLSTHPARNLVQEMSATHLVEAAGVGSEVTLSFDFELKRGPLPWMMLKVSERKLRRELEHIMSSWQARMLETARLVAEGTN